MTTTYLNGYWPKYHWPDRYWLIFGAVGPVNYDVDLAFGLEMEISGAGSAESIGTVSVNILKSYGKSGRVSSFGAVSLLDVLDVIFVVGNRIFASLLFGRYNGCGITGQAESVGSAILPVELGTDIGNVAAFYGDVWMPIYMDAADAGSASVISEWDLSRVAGYGISALASAASEFNLSRIMAYGSFAVALGQGGMLLESVLALLETVRMDGFGSIALLRENGMVWEGFSEASGVVHVILSLLHGITTEGLAKSDGQVELSRLLAEFGSARQLALSRMDLDRFAGMDASSVRGGFADMILGLGYGVSSIVQSDAVGSVVVPKLSVLLPLGVVQSYSTLSVEQKVVISVYYGVWRELIPFVAYINRLVGYNAER